MLLCCEYKHTDDTHTVQVLVDAADVQVSMDTGL